jgi:hypothetical protein
VLQIKNYNEWTLSREKHKTVFSFLKNILEQHYRHNYGLAFALGAPTLQRKSGFMHTEKKLRGLSPNFHIHVSVRDLFIPTIDLLILLQEICGPILGIYTSLTDT